MKVKIKKEELNEVVLMTSDPLLVPIRLQIVNGSVALICEAEKGAAEEIPSIKVMERIATVLSHQKIAHRKLTRSCAGDEHIDMVVISTEKG